jgi:hypothetical protein
VDGDGYSSNGRLKQLHELDQPIREITSRTKFTILPAVFPFPDRNLKAEPARIQFVTIPPLRFLQSARIRKQIDAMYRAFPQATVEEFERLEKAIVALDLWDVEDGHLVAAAVPFRANFIVADNLKDFPNNPPRVSPRMRISR